MIETHDHEMVCFRGRLVPVLGTVGLRPEESRETARIIERFLAQRISGGGAQKQHAKASRSGASVARIETAHMTSETTRPKGNGDVPEKAKQVKVTRRRCPDMKGGSEVK